MLTQKNKRIAVAAAVVLMCLLSAAYSKSDDEIDLTALQQADPFARFTQGTQTTQDRAMPAMLKPELFVKTVTLKFLDATSLQGCVEKMSSEWGSMTPDIKTNSLIICDTEENLEKILAQIREADKKPEQIMIEVVLVDVKLNDDTEIGVNWDQLTGSSRNPSYRQNIGFSNRLETTKPDSSLTDTFDDLTAFVTTNTGADFSIVNGDIRNVIHMLQEKNNVEILASPRVMVLSSQTASIESVEEIPYTVQNSTGEGGTIEDTEFKNVGITLNVTATLTDENLILLVVDAEQGSYTGELNNVPTVDTRKIQSSLLLEDSQILVIGGLRKKHTQKQTEQLPILGDMPVVGDLFKATKTSQYNSELLVILSPHIYKGERPDESQMKKFDEITKQPLLTIPEVEEKEKEQKIKEEKEKEREKKKEAKIKKEKAKKESKGIFSGLFSMSK
ncbi:MAG: hypothetical protein A2173_08265 [Planctomycetes bacterium RBG_13_44_8b]|nr:MAG: hypothetical protein A2173_08265 [Planctomycetes bacterium RBG_13_44_8b]